MTYYCDIIYTIFVACGKGELNMDMLTVREAVGLLGDYRMEQSEQTLRRCLRQGKYLVPSPRMEKSLANSSRRNMAPH